MGFFTKLSDLCFRSEPGGPPPRSGSRTTRLAKRRRRCRCQVEPLEPRRLMAIDAAPHVVLGSVYFEEATGDDSQPDIIEVSFVGGAAGTTLDRLVIHGDKQQDGLSEGDIFFDTAAGGLGAFSHFGLSIVSTQGFTIGSVTVVDGGSQIIFTFSGFEAGDRLKFSLDVDEAQFVEPGAINNGQIDPTKVDTNPLVEGAEFQRSLMVGEFSATGYVDLTLTGTYWDSFDDEFHAAQAAAGRLPTLPNDAYSPTHDFTDRTAGAVAYATQTPLATLAGWVYHDRSDDGVFDRGAGGGEHGIGGVTLELLDAFGNPTGITTTTSADPSNLGYYEFRNLVPGTYGVREVQPQGWLDGKDTPGSHGGTAADESAGPVDRIIGAVLNYDDDAVEYNFGELLPGSIRGRVHAGTGPGCNFEDPEILLAGVRMDLLDSGNVIAHTLTNSQGEYAFTGLAPGIYTVREHQPAEYYDGGERVGTAGGVASDVGSFSIIAGINITSDLHAIHYDFCEKIGVTLAGNVYHDRDDDGIFDRDSEEGIGGVVVRLLDASGNDTGLRATTDSAGAYKFNNLRAGTYTVVEVHPSGWLDGKDTPGNLGGVAAVSPPGDTISGITINWGQMGTEYNFGELLPGSIHGRVHADPGADCDFDHPHNLLAGVRIDLFDASGNLLTHTFTNDAGEYSFTGLRPGTYSVREHNPTGYFDGGERVGTAGGTASDVGDFSIIAGIGITSGLDAFQYDFCEKPPSSIRGRVHADLDGDCDFDSPDLVLAGLTIQLLDAHGNVIATTTTDAGGEYLFDGLAPGEYQVHELQPAGYYDGMERVGTAGGALDGIDTIHSIFLVAGTHATQYDFCEHVGVMLSGNVYHDRNDDGVFDRGTEEGIAGVVVKLLDEHRGDTGLRTTTDAAGYYKFNNLAAGKYTVMEVHPSGWIDGKDTAGNLGGIVDPAPGGDMISMIPINWGQMGNEYNFGELLPGSIRGQVVVSTDPDCDPDDGEPPIAGVRIDLLDAAGNLVAHTFTDANGEYAFTNLHPGTYSVREHQPSGYFDLDAHLGSGGGVRVSTNLVTSIHVGSDQHLTDYDFCEEPPAELSGFVFIDGPPIVTNDPLTPEQIAQQKDGIRTPDDRPLAGVMLELRDGTSGEPITIDSALPGTYSGAPGDVIRVVTDTNGFYHFGGLRGGTYAVVEVTPAGLIDGIDTAGTLGGYPVNPVVASGSPLGPDSVVPPLEVQKVIEQFRIEFGNDAIVRIPLRAGEHAQLNNFSEVETRPLPPPPPPPPPVVVIPPTDAPPPPTAPRVFPIPGVPYVPPMVIAPTLPEYALPTSIATASAVGYTWHLSVVNAGMPRSVQSTTPFQLTSSHIDVVGWNNVPLDHGRWTLAVVDYNGPVVVREEVFGHPDARPVVGDFNGDGTSDLGVFLDGQWFLDVNGNGRWDEGDLWAHLGSVEDLPVTGDWDADGKSDIGIFGPAWPGDPWAVLQEPGLPDPDNFPTHPAGKRKNVPPAAEEATSGGRVMKLTAQAKSRADLIDHVFHYGTPGDVPVAGDWNGDGVRQIAAFRDGEWILDLDGNGRLDERDAIVRFGRAGDVPVVGDFNGDGVEDLGVFRAGVWLLDTTGDRQLDAQDKVFELGEAGDVPIVGDWNDDGIDDPGVYSPLEITDRVSCKAG